MEELVDAVIPLPEHLKYTKSFKFLWQYLVAVVVLMSLSGSAYI